MAKHIYERGLSVRYLEGSNEHSKNHTGAEFCIGTTAAGDGAIKIRAAYLEEKWLWLIRRLPRRNLDDRIFDRGIED
jgi:hypothetical protein